jgi:AraC-like DNA-binding protein
MTASALFTLPALRRARDLIDLRYAEPLDLAGLAREAGYSKFHFARAFATAYGETPRAYLTRRRLERAKTLLRVANLTITEICFLVGFESLGSFSSLFRRVVGQTPSAYRRESARQGGPLPIPGCVVLMCTRPTEPQSRRSAHGAGGRRVAAQPTEDQP